MNKRILVTGASRGIGRALCTQLYKEGYDLIIVSRNEDKLLELKHELGDLSDRIIICKADVGTIEGAKSISLSVEKAGGVYAVVNNAAIAHIGLLSDMTYEEWNKVIDTNLNSVFYVSKAVIPYMVSNKEGKIINISSVWGNVGASMEVAYSASKGGVNAYTKALAKELAPSNIQVNAVAFGVIDTDMNSELSKEDMDNLKSEIPADRISTPSEAAAMIVNVLNAPAYMTGQIITMDGGWI